MTADAARFWGGPPMTRTMTSFMALALSAGLALPMTAAAQDHAPRPAATGYKAPRAADGHPDLQGVWTSATVTRLERNPRYSKTLAMTEAETKKIEGGVKAEVDLG